MACLLARGRVTASCFSAARHTTASFLSWAPAPEERRVVGGRTWASVGTSRVASMWHMMTSRRGVVLTGQTLEASLKMRCDTSGAVHSIYWTKVKDEFVVAGEYCTPARKAELSEKILRDSYSQASASIKLNANGDGPVATVHKTGKPLFIKEAASAKHMVRREFIEKYGIDSILLIPFEDGVLECGTSVSPLTTKWSTTPAVANIPNSEMRKAFERFGAVYVIFWAKQGDKFCDIADYVTPERILALKNRRADDKTFCSESRGYQLDANGSGMVATAARTGEKQFLAHAAREPSFRRAPLAKEFGIETIHFVPVDGGVLEYGIPTEAKLSGNTLQAAMKMRCDTSGATYAAYWTEIDGSFVVGAGYVTPERKAALEAQGKEGNFVEASRGVQLDASGNGPVATVGRTGEPLYIADARSCTTMKRLDQVKEFGITSIAFVPIEGGVLEFGTTHTQWGNTMPPALDLPLHELKRAFGNGCVGLVFWQRDGDKFVATSDYILPEFARTWKARRGDDKNFGTESRGSLKTIAEGDYVTTAALSGKAFTIRDAKTDPQFRRQKLAQEFNIGELHLVPCKDGVLECRQAISWTADATFSPPKRGLFSSLWS